MDSFHFKFLRKFQSCHSSSLLLIILLCIFLQQQKLSCQANPVSAQTAVTNAAAASELHPRELAEVRMPSSTSYWIGSHTLNFTPNPFLQRKSEARSSSSSAFLASDESDSTSSSTSTVPASQIEMSTSATATTTNVPQQINNNKGSDSNEESIMRPRRKGRKVKGRRRNRNRNRNSTSSSSDSNNNSKSEGRSAKNVKSRRSRARFEAKEAQVIPPQAQEAIPSENELSQRVLLPVPVNLDIINSNADGVKSANHLPIEEMVYITTPEPILPAYIDPKRNQIPVDFSNVDPDKLNPSYFRNIILKSMMDRLAGVGLVTRVPNSSV